MSGALSVLNTVGRVSYRLGFEISPIILTGESQITQFAPGNMVPIVALTEGLNLVEGVLADSFGSLDDFFAHFVPVPGSTMIDQQIGAYPFANAAIAANATIANPLSVALQMICPVKQQGGYFAKLATLTFLQFALSQHNASGGTYIVATPSFIYTNCIMTSMRDVSTGEGKQHQTRWQFEFVKPLITQQQAAGAYNTLMSKVDQGLPTDGSLSGPGVTVGQPLTSAAPSAVPSASGLPGAGVPTPAVDFGVGGTGLIG